MKRETPPLDALEAFLQAARASSFREAADALAISPSAFLRLPAGTDDDMPCTPKVPMPPGQAAKEGNPATQMD